MSSHPMQPIEVAEDGVVRFKANKIVRWLVDEKRVNLNEIAMHVALGKFDADDAAQFWQQIGYSVSGYGDLDFVPQDTVAKADEIAAPMWKAEASEHRQQPSGKTRRAYCPILRFRRSSSSRSSNLIWST